MARQKSTFSVPLQTDILSGGNVGLSFGNGPLPVSDLIFLCIFFLIGIMAIWVMEFSNWGLERFLPKNQYTKRKLLNFEFSIHGELSKSDKI